jgi:hypothetical protein
MRKCLDIAVVHFHISALFQFISDESFNIHIGGFSGRSSLRLNTRVSV